MRTSAVLSYSRIEITKDSRTKCLGRVHESRDEVLASHCNPPQAVYSYLEALHLGHLMAAHGYFFPIDDHVLTVKADGTFYRFQVWPILILV
ncbi:hypothetical protein AVEN_157908-1 [Araneus ventricosus]|uniref:Uncharacterized protein n=1 Tax=Araneus ventricosus TaxID=182803 RepID=A0A4Y2FJL5_ARAVE|nr:hypothetical protein AVEN_157908-1 [Araneus ventricosus]